MYRCQTLSQLRFTELQPCTRTLKNYRSQKSRLEILGSLFVCVGFTLCKPAYSAPEVPSQALSVAPTDQPEVLTGDSSQTDILVSPSPPTLLLPEESWDTEDTRTKRSGDRETWRSEDAQKKDTDTKLRSDKVVETDGETGRRVDGEKMNVLRMNATQYKTQERGNAPKDKVRSVAEQFSSSVHGNIPEARAASLSFSSIKVQPFNASQSSLPFILKGVNAFSDTQPPVPCSITPQQTVTPEEKQQCSPSSPTLLTQLEQGYPSEVLPLPAENPSESEQRLGADPELGILRLRELPAPPPPSKPAVYLLGGAGYFRSNNIFSGVDPVDDGVFRTGLTLLAVPSLGPQTSLFASVGGNLFRYNDLSEYDYNELKFNAGIRQQIGKRSYGELGWSNRQLFSKDGGDRFLNDHSAYLELGRQDFLTERLTLDTYYQLRLSFANPSDRSQVINTVGASLSYSLSPTLLLALDYQFAFADFTQQEREDKYHQLLARMNYTLSPNSRLYLFGGKSFGSSSDSEIDFNGLVFGLGVDFSLTLF